MPSNAITQKGQRGLRVKLGGSILAVVLLENALDEGIRVNVIFHLGSSVRSRAQMLFPMWATKGCLQPFRFLELSEASRAGLNHELQSLVRGGASQEPEEEPE